MTKNDYRSQAFHILGVMGSELKMKAMGVEWVPLQLFLGPFRQALKLDGFPCWADVMALGVRKNGRFWEGSDLAFCGFTLSPASSDEKRVIIFVRDTEARHTK